MREVVASFTYQGADGRPIARIDRIEGGDAGKCFLPYLAMDEGEFSKRAGLDGRRLPVYRLPEVRRAIEGAATVYLTEGEGKADHLRRVLAENAVQGAVTTIHGGANATLTAEHLAQFEGVETLCVLADSDKPGAYAAQCRAQLIGEKYPGCEVRLVDLFPDRDDGSDVKDFLEEGGSLADFLARVRAASSIVPLGSDAPRTGWVSMGELLSTQETETPWLAEGLLARGGTSLVVAKPKVGKSTLLQNLAFCVARGQQFLGRHVRPGPVLYLALEEIRSELFRHFSAMGATAEDEIFLWVGRAPADAVEWLRAEAVNRKPALIIIDTLQRFARLPDINDYASATTMLDLVGDVARESKAHIAMSHHGRKSGGDNGDAVLGSTALFGCVDTLLEMQKRDGVRSLSSTQRYGDNLEETIIGLDRDTYRVRSDGILATFDQQRLETEMATFLERCPEPVTQEEILDAVSGRKEKKLAALKALIEGRAIVRLGAGKKGEPFTYRLAVDGPIAGSEHERFLVSGSDPIRGVGNPN